MARSKRGEHKLNPCGNDSLLSTSMQIGVIGLGRMGGNISRRLMKAGHHCVVFDVNAKLREALAKEGRHSWVAFGSHEGARGEATCHMGDVARLALPNRRSSNWVSCSNRTTLLSMAAIPSIKTIFAVPRN